MAGLYIRKRKHFYTNKSRCVGCISLYPEKLSLMCAANAGGRFVWIAPTSMIPLLMTVSELYKLQVKGSAQLVLS